MCGNIYDFRDCPICRTPQKADKEALVCLIVLSWKSVGRKVDGVSTWQTSLLRDTQVFALRLLSTLDEVDGESSALLKFY